MTVELSCFVPPLRHGTTATGPTRTCHGRDLQALWSGGRGKLTARLGGTSPLQHAVVLALRGKHVPTACLTVGAAHRGVWVWALPCQGIELAALHKQAGKHSQQAALLKLPLPTPRLAASSRRPASYLPLLLLAKQSAKEAARGHASCAAECLRSLDTPLRHLSPHSTGLEHSAAHGVCDDGVNAVRFDDVPAAGPVDQRQQSCWLRAGTRVRAKTARCV